MKSFLDRLRPTRRDLVDATVVFTLTTIALWSFRSSYGGFAFFILGAVFTAIGILLAFVGYRFELPFPLIAVIALLVYAIIGGAAALPQRTFSGLPTPTSFLVALRSTVTGWKELITTAPPVGATGDLMAVPVFAAIASGFLSFTAALRSKIVLLALVPPTVVLALGIATGVKTPVSVVLHGVVFAAVAVAWLAWREHVRRPLLHGSTVPRRQLAMAAAVLLVTGAAGQVLGQSLAVADDSARDIWRQTVVPPFDPRQYPSPLSGYRSYVKEARDSETDGPVMFTVEGLPEGIPVRLATMDAYDGLVWQVSAGDPEEPSLYDSGSFERVGVSIEPEYPGEITTVVVTIGDYNDVWIPDVGEVIEMRFTGSEGGSARDRELANQFRYNRSTDTAASRVPLQAGDRYEMTVRLPVALDDLDGEQLIPTVPRLGPTASVSEIAQKLAGPELLAASDTGKRLEMVRDIMVQYGTYSDGDRESGQVRARAGHSAQRLGTFVQDFPKTPLIGNAEQFSATYALLFRDLGRIPTRVVMGFLPEEGSEGGPVDVHSNQIEAWVEVPFADFGWVAVFPTPPRDQTAITTSAPLQPEPDYRTQNPPPPPLIDPEFDQPATAAGEAQSPVADEVEEEEAIPGDPLIPPESVRVIRLGVLVLSPFLAVLLAVGIIAVIKSRRRRKRRSGGPGHERMANGWREVTDFAVDTGQVIPSGVTRREAAQLVGTDTMDLAQRADAAVWSAGEPDDDTVDAFWDDIVARLTAMKSQLGFFERIKTKASLHSLKSGWSDRRNGAAGGRNS